MNEDAYVPHGVVRLLVERGRLDVLRAEAGRGDWSCAAALGEELVRRGEADAALEVYRAFQPEVRRGAAESIAAILETSRGVEDAIAFMRPRAGAGDRDAVHWLASLLGRHGRVDEAIELLRPWLDDWWLAEALVEVTAGQGRDEDVVAELETLVAAVERHPDPWRAEPSNAAELLSTVLERQGRSDEAVALLRRIRRTSVNQLERLADLLRDAGRESDLRDLVEGEGREDAAYRLAELLEGQGRPAEAADVLRTFADQGNTNAASALADLLHRTGRVDEAIEVLAATHGCTLTELCTILVEEGRPEDALDRLEELERDFDPEHVFRDRIWLLEACGRREEALDLVRAHPDAAEDRMLQLAAAILDRLGRTDEAIALLRPCATARYVGDVLAELLLRRGDVDEAMAVVHAREPLKLWADDPWADDAWADDTA